MTGFQIFGLILLPFALFFLSFANQRHRDEHGVNAPSRRASARIRRNARKEGISTDQAHASWVENKQAREGVSNPASAWPAHRLQNANPTAPLIPPAPSTVPEPSSIREWLRASGMTLNEVADATGISVVIVQQIENGTRSADADTTEQLIAVMRTARDALPAPRPFDDIVTTPRILYQPTGRVSTGGYVAGHYRKDGTWVKPHWRKPKGYR